MDSVENTEVTATSQLLPEINPQPNSKTLEFYYKGNSQKIKFFPGTSSENVLKLVFKLFHLDKVEPDQSVLLKHVLLLDSEGIPMVFEPNAIPTDEKLYMTFDCNLKESVQTSSVSRSRTKRVKWSKDWNTRVCKGNYVVNESGTEVKHQGGGHSMPLIITDTPLKKGDGIQKFKIHMNGPGYNFAGIAYGNDLKNEVGASQWGNDFTQIPSFQNTFNGASTVKFDFDMDKLKAEINGNKFDLPDDNIYLGVSMKHEVSTAQIIYDD